MVEISGKEVRDRYPVAWEVLVGAAYDNDRSLSWFECEAVTAWENTFTVDPDGTLWLENDVPSSPLRWVEGSGWWMDFDEVMIPIKEAT